MIAMNRTINAPPNGLTLLLTGGEALVTGTALRSAGRDYDVASSLARAGVRAKTKVAVVGLAVGVHALADIPEVGQARPVGWLRQGHNNSDFTAIMCYAPSPSARSSTLQGHRRDEPRIQRGEVDGRRDLR